VTRPANVPRVCAIIVTFEPQLDTLTECIARIEPQVDRICLVDNSNNPLAHQSIKYRWPNLTYLGQGTNQGIARAHNAGISWAVSLAFDYLLLLDQDSLANPDLIARQLLAFQTLQKQDCMPAAIGASYMENLSQQRSAFVQIRWPRCRRVFYKTNADNLVAADSLISSGTLFYLPTLQTIGPMDESLFIDHVDTEWFLRAKFKGFQAYGAWDATMTHTLGGDTRRLWFGRWHRYPLYPPERYYYIFRNSLLLRRMPWASFAWRAFDARRLVRIAILNMLLGKNRRATLRCTLAGIRDGILGRSGQQPNY
jgi:rhamnosyltransferase